jgi:hypothetical protein
MPYSGRVAFIPQQGTSSFGRTAASKKAAGDDPAAKPLDVKTSGHA